MKEVLSSILYRNPMLLYLSIVIILLAGTTSYFGVPKIEDPPVVNRNVNIVTPFQGASAELVESLVTEKIETALDEIPEINHHESYSLSNLSLIKIELHDEIDYPKNEEVFSKIQNKINDIKPTLPKEIRGPFFDRQDNYALGFTYILSFTWKGEENDLSLAILTRLAHELGDKLRVIKGTDYVEVFGGVEEEVEVKVDPVYATTLGRPANELAQQIYQADSKRPSGVYRGKESDLNLLVEGEFKTLDRIASIPIVANNEGSVLNLGDIADIQKAYKNPPKQISYNNGNRSVLLAARIGTEIQIADWTEKADKVINSMRQYVNGDIEMTLIFNQKDYVLNRLNSLFGNLLLGVVFVIIVVFFSMGFKPSVIVSSALPLTICLIFFGLAFFGRQIEQIAVFGMIISIGLLIDNAIIVVDQIRKEIILHKSGRIEALKHSVHHLFAPLLASTITTVTAFLPIFLLPGPVGDFITSMALSVIIALIGSFIISLTIVATLSAKFISSEGDVHSEVWKFGLSFPKIAAATEKLLYHLITKKPLLGLLLSCLIPAIGFFSLGSFKRQFFPQTDRNQFQLEVWMVPNTPIETTTQTVLEIDEFIRQDPHVTDSFFVVGRSSPPVYYNQLLLIFSDPSYSRGIFTTKEDVQDPAFIQELENQVRDKFRNAIIVLRPLAQGPPTKAPTAFRLSGPSLRKLQEYSEKLRLMIAQDESIIFTRTNSLMGKPEIDILVDEDKAALTGFTLTNIASQLDASLEGAYAGSLIEGLEELPVRVKYLGANKATQNIGDTRLINSRLAAKWTPLSAIADLKLKPKYYTIYHYNGEPSIDVMGYPLLNKTGIEIAHQIMPKFKKEVPLDPGYTINFEGEAKDEEKAVGNLGIYAPVLLAVAIVTLILSLNSILLALHIFIVAILSLGLGLFCLSLTSYPLGFNPIVGNMGLVGVAINGSIVILAALKEHAKARQGDPETIIYIVMHETRHIFSTILTTVVGFLPLLIFVGGAFWSPIAIVIAGGVGLSFVLSLLFTPIVFSFLAKRGWIT